MHLCNTRAPSRRAWAAPLAVLSLTLAGAFAAPAHAGLHAESSWSNLSFTVIDLDLDDGIEAGYTLLGAGGSTFAQAYSRRPGEAFHPPVTDIKSWSGEAAGTASASAEDGGISVGVTMGDAARDARSTSQAHDFGDGNGAVSQYFNLELRANTRLEVSVDASLRLEDDRALATAKRDLGGYVILSFLEGAAEYEDKLSEQLFSPQDFLALNRHLSISFDSGSQGLAGSLSLQGFSYVEAGHGLPPPPVPEPSTYALLAGGLGLLGFQARRRQRGSAS
ncbi:PEP-CTERM sorting domain-containing protein [Aquabacterium sp. A7-Y]|uniref:PEP-CTERM sorting domain-containing protein n=1 Tax=Aquabacterium sp. A7-Y TaxID=1349605 RepID=UPI00223D32FB|nr:PEP-CTERM sorting domain-containing protein [Aquabacterium sp. A7-Y]MCW7538135.1 PEP-CTERM sorting domain-containing protein [Aquabacterium sp. A7-Y]